MIEILRRNLHLGTIWLKFGIVNQTLGKYYLGLIGNNDSDLDLFYSLKQNN